MRTSYVTVLSCLALVACSDGSNGEAESVSEAPESPGEEAEPSLQLPDEPRMITDDAAAIVGMTSDDQVIYRSSQGLMAAGLEENAAPMLISDRAGTVVIVGAVVFQWVDLDWTTNLGHLMVWTAQHGTREIGPALYGDGMVAATPEGGGYILYVADVQETTVDLILASADLATNQPLIADMGRGGESTCRASFGFAADKIIVGWCAAGSSAATIERWNVQGLREQTPLATGVRPAWSADELGNRVFFIKPDSTAMFWDAGQELIIDRGAAWGMLVPDGSAALYTVNDQLRRSPLPQALPTPVVATGFVARTDWSPDFRYVLYSTRVTYEGGTRRDLFLSSTEAFNEVPEQLVVDPAALMSRSAFTSDGEWALYLTDPQEAGATLNMKPCGGGPSRTLPGVDTVVAAHQGRVLFSDNRSDPNTYPITSDLKVVDAAGGPPIVMKNRILDGRTFALSTARDRVVYIVPRGGDPALDVPGLHVQGIP